MAAASSLRREHCRLERGSSRFVFGRESVECQFERGSVSAADGKSALFSGPPPAPFCNLRLPPRTHPRTLRAARAAVSALSAGAGCAVRLSYSAVVAHRVSTEPVTANEPPLRSSAVWSLTGSIRSATNGASIPLGWSGAGDGLEWISRDASTELRRVADQLARAKPAQTGVFDTVLSPAAAAVLAHEAIGHVAEAAAGAPERRLPRRIASEVLDAFDHPSEPGGPARYEYDDENIRSLGPTLIVRQGLLISELHSQETASRAGALPTGNSRCDCVWHRPIPRFSNLICRGGERTEEALVAGVRDGLYILRLANGVYNGASVTADVALAERIRNGKRTNCYCTGGRVEETSGVLLRVVEAAGNVRFHDNALCGKSGQLLFDVGTAAPSLHVRQLRIVAC